MNNEYALSESIWSWVMGVFQSPQLAGYEIEYEKMHLHTHVWKFHTGKSIVIWWGDTDDS